MIKAVLFDAGNTLLRVKSSVGDVYADFANHFDVIVDGIAVNRAFKVAWNSYRSRYLAYTATTDEKREKVWWHGLVSQVFEGLGLKEKFGANFEAYFELLYKHFAEPENWEVYEDVIPTLTRLREKKIRLAVISNWDSRLHRIFQEVGLEQYFEFVITSAEFGKEKPHPDIFLHALKLLDILPHEAIYVGDLYQDDVLGADNAGLIAVLIDREARQHNSHLWIPTLSDLPALINSLKK